MKTLSFIFLLVMFITSLLGEENPKALDQFLVNHCFECHDEDVKKGDLDLASITFSPDDLKNAKIWQKVFKAVSNGDMPPKNKTQPSEETKTSFLTLLETPLYISDLKHQKEQGRTRARRINRVEFERTLSDIFGINLNIKEMLPEDASKDGFDTVGEALNVSSVQISAYLDTIDYVLDQATTLYDKPEFKQYELKYQQNISLMQTYRRGGSFLIRDDGIVMFSPQKHAHLNPELGQYVVPYNGKYKIRFKARSIRSEKTLTLNVRTGGRGHFESNEVPQTQIGYINVPTDQLTEFEFDGELTQGQVIRIYPEMLPFMRFTNEGKAMGVNKDWTGKQEEFKGPGVHIESVHVEGPFIEDWPPKSHQVLWGGVKTIVKKDVAPNLNPNRHLDVEPNKIAKPRLTKGPRKKGGGNPYIFDPNQKIKGEVCYGNAPTIKPYHNTYEFSPENSKSEAKRLITKFAPLAFRRAVSSKELTRHFELVYQWLDAGVSFEESMRAGYKSILTSPHFLFHQSSFEKNGEITSRALSERLAYFLWSSKPDEELMNLAAKGKLNQSKVLSSQVDRMLKDPRADAFIENFLGQWLDLRKMDFTEPDSKLYPEFDPVLKWSMKEEVHAFFKELLDKDLSVENFIDSNFAMLNQRLARHYNISGVEGMEIRRVPLPKNTPRGGVMGMSAIHKVTANGAATSPIIRGVWILERIMGIHPPPPPSSVDGIEPDIRGTVTILEQLKEHRNNGACSSCHQLIDPPGVALENFDVIGAWRTNYRNLNVDKASKRIKFVPNAPLPIVYDQGLEVVSAYQLRDGRKFKDIKEFKQLCLEAPEGIAKNVLEKLFTYATGASIKFSDKKTLKAILKNVKDNHYGLRSIIHEMVQSDLFKRK